MPVIRIGTICAIGLLISTFFLKFEALMILAIGGMILGIAFGLAVFQRLDKLAFITILNYAYWLTNGLVSGGIRLVDLYSPTFYANDGRAFLYYLPLVFFCTYRARPRDVELIIRVLKYLVAVSAALFVFWLITKNPLLSAGKALNFSGFLSSHTGAGTFYGIITTFLAVYGLRLRSKSITVYAFVSLICVFGSASRQAIVSLVAVGMWYLVSERRLMVALKSGLFALVAAVTMFYVTPHTFDRLTEVVSMDTVESIGSAVSKFDWEPAPGVELGDTESNILSRIMLWTYAVQKAQQSPIVGIGFGRINDYYLTFSGVNGISAMATNGVNQNNPYNTHNSYLQLIAEQGFIGLGLLCWLWIVLYRRLGRLSLMYTDQRGLAEYWIACRALILFTFVSAMFDHALAAPSIGFPVLTLAGLGIAIGRYLDERMSIRT